MGSMKVLSMPDYRAGNPYQDYLSKSLNNFNVQTLTSNGESSFPVLGAVRKCWKPDLIHFHWTHPFFISTSMMKSISKGAVYF